MNKDNRHASLTIIVCLAVLNIGATVIGSGGSRESRQANLVHAVSPADLVLQATDPVGDTAKLGFEYDPHVAYVRSSKGEAPIKLPASAKNVNLRVCDYGWHRDRPGELRNLQYEAFDSASAQIGDGSWDLEIAPDTTKPSVRVISPKNGTMVTPGETIEIVVAGEESQPATTCIRRLTLVDPALNTQSSPETPQKACEGKQSTSEHHFHYTVPRDAEPGLLSFTAAAEDWAKNIGFETFDLIYLPAGLTGVWTTEGRLTKPDEEYGYSIYAAFSFTFNPRTGAVECGTLTKHYCGSARISFLPGREKGAGGWCAITFTPAANVFKIVAHGLRQGNELKFLSIKPTGEYIPNRYRKDCPGTEPTFDWTGLFAVGPILPEGITIAMPLMSSHTTVTKHESSRSGFDLNHKVELYLPRENR